jgi:hypothetical protein
MIDKTTSRRLPLFISVFILGMALAISIFFKNPPVGTSIAFISTTFAVCWYVLFPACDLPPEPEPKKEE